MVDNGENIEKLLGFLTAVQASPWKVCIDEKVRVPFVIMYFLALAKAQFNENDNI